MEKIETAVQWIINIANDRSHGYDQNNRWGPDYDCSSLVISAWDYAGAPVKANGASYTGDMKLAFLESGFSDVTSQVNLSTGNGLQRGDVLLNIQSHTVMYIGGGEVVSASLNEFGGITGGEPGDQNGREIYIRPYYNKPWDCVLRYAADDSGTTHLTPSGNQYIRQGQAEANNFVGADIPITDSFDAATRKAGIKVLQKAMNLDYGADLNVDGVWGPATERALGNHYVEYGECQYMVTACQILLLMHALNPNGVEYPGIFGEGCLSAVKKFQIYNELPVTGRCDKNTFIKLGK